MTAVLNGRYPCCGQSARLVGRAVGDRVRRQCPRCRQRYVVTIGEAASAGRVGVPLLSASWERRERKAAAA